MPPHLSTARLDLLPATRDDLDTLGTLWDHPEVRRFLFDDLPVNCERADEIFGHCLQAVDADLGYASEALAAVSRHAFDSLGLSRLAAVVDMPNSASGRLARRLGFEVTTSARARARFIESGIASANLPPHPATG